MAASEMTTFISLFHSAEGAEQALNALEKAGFSRSMITSTWKNDATSNPASYADELTHLGVPARDLRHFQEVIGGGGVAISLEAAADRSDDIEGIFHRYSATKIDEADVERGALASAPVATPRLAAEPMMAAGTAVVPVVEEELVVGKRDVDRGGVRVFQRTVEKQVSESVNLHEEHVVFDRKPVDRAVTDADMANAGKTIELTETDEVPVVSKSARVVEEVHVGKVGSDRVDTVQENVRHTEVEVEQLATDGRSTSDVRPKSDTKSDRY